MPDSPKKKNILATLRDKCFSRLSQLRAAKPRYYADSEHHRLKLRLVQTLAIIESCQPTEKCPLDDRFIHILLHENNQLNITYILECIIANRRSMIEFLDQVR